MSMVAALVAAALSDCIPVYSKCHQGSADSCCDGSSCFEKNHGYSQCRPSCPTVDDWKCHVRTMPPPQPPVAVLKAAAIAPPKATASAAPKPAGALEPKAVAAPKAAADRAVAGSNGADEKEMAPVGLLNAVTDPIGWQLAEGEEPCTLKILVGRSPAPTFAETMEYRVPSMMTYIHSDVGDFGINLCGIAQPPEEVELGHVRDRFLSLIHI